MSGELTAQTTKATTIRDLLVKNQEQIKAALPTTLRTDRFIRIAMTSMARTPALYDCTPRSLYGAVIQCAQLGLEPDDLRGLAHLIPFKNKGSMEVQVMLGYKGLIELAHRSGRISDIKAEVVYEKDTFNFQMGTQEFLKHTPSLEQDPGGPICAYAIVRFKDGSQRCDVLPPRDIEKARNSSNAFRFKSGPWVTHPAEMWKKTAIRRLLKTIPLSPEVESAVALDERESAGVDQGLSVMGEVDEMSLPKKSPGRLDKLAEEMGGQNGEEDRPPVHETTDKKPEAPEVEGKAPEVPETEEQRTDSLIKRIRDCDAETLEAMADSLQAIKAGLSKVKNRIKVDKALEFHRKVLAERKD